MNDPIDVKKTVIYSVIGLIVFSVLAIGGIAGCKEFQRYQKRADANNNVKVTTINIRKAQQEARIVRAQIEATKAKAEQRYQESIGIRKAQDEIAATLTPLYVQHEAISKLPSARAVYIPSGAQGIPLVNDISKATPK